MKYAPYSPEFPVRHERTGLCDKEKAINFITIVMIASLTVSGGN